MQLQCLFAVFLFLQTVSGENVLIWPAEGSHWINLRPVIEGLIQRGHNVTVAIHTGTMYINYTKPSAIRFEVFDVPFSREEMTTVFNRFLEFWIYESSHVSYWQGYQTIVEQMAMLTGMETKICDGILKNNKLMQKLQQSNFKVLISDPVAPCGDILALKLGIPFVFTLRMSPGFSMERLCGHLPAPPSFVPTVMSGLPDTMSFTERIGNVFYVVMFDLISKWIFWRDWDSYYTEVLGEPTTLCETVGKADLWLIRTYWDFDFPRPVLPNFVFVGGIHCKPAKSLPQEIEEFVQSSGEHGIVVFSLGSMIKNLTSERADIIAAALGQIPQKVLWRYVGERPKTLATNTKLYDWLPQNDLLGHKKTRAFITHGGTNGIYEAIYHAVPLVGIPMFADQPDNLSHMKAKGMAMVLNFNTMTTQDLVHALNTVINEPRYKENAMRLSSIQHDQPMTPLDTAIFWIEFVMRHKGAKHLRPASHSLTWYQYHSLDVIAFLCFCLAVALYIPLKCCMCCYRKVRSKPKRKGKKD